MFVGNITHSSGASTAIRQTVRSVCGIGGSHLDPSHRLRPTPLLSCAVGASATTARPGRKSTSTRNLSLPKSSTTVMLGTKSWRPLRSDLSYDPSSGQC